MSSNGLKSGRSWYKDPLKQGVPKKTPHYKGHLFWCQNTALLQGPLISRMAHSEGDTLLFLEIFLREGVPAPSSRNQTMSFSPNSDHSVAHHNRIIVCRTHNFVCLPGCQPYHRIFWNLHMRTNSWVMTLGYLSVCPSVHVHLALSGALSGPDNVGLWRTVWFCCRVWLFDRGSYLNRKEIIIVSTLECMPMDSTIVYSWKVQISNFLGRIKTGIFIQLVRVENRAARFLRRTTKCPKNMYKKKTRETLEESSMGFVIFIVSRDVDGVGTWWIFTGQNLALNKCTGYRSPP